MKEDIPSWEEKKKQLFRRPSSAWHRLSEGEEEKAFTINEEYKDFLNEGKNERFFIEKSLETVRAEGFIPFEEAENLQAGDKVYFTNRKKNLLLAVIGKNGVDRGFSICASHVDAPRLDVKPNPLNEDGESGAAYLKTHYYGGVKKYQWTQIPLALTGVVVLKDGTVKKVDIGSDPADPVFTIPDILIHLSGKVQGDKKMPEVITGEQLNVLVAHRPVDDREMKEAVKLTALEILNHKYAMTEEDFLSAELEVVPAANARDLGLDRSMILAHGQDDRVCSYANLRGLLDLEETPERTCIAFLADKEETGSRGSTGMDSHFFYHSLSQITAALKKDYSEVLFRELLNRSHALSTDVAAAVNYNFKSVHDLGNAAKLGYGVNINKYTGARGKVGSNDADAEYMASLRKLLDDHDIPWQISELGKVDEGGGGTVAFLLARHGIHTIDMGTPVMGMHAPLEITSKIDVYATCRACRVFYESFQG
ncbi:MAG: aminopeptidase [Spirochaetales bacterium]|nr:aminopeptidase [Spirochaetales bacterium]